jgi:transcriptional regulator with XRE-family HTH domain
MNIGERIKIVRESKNLSIREFADKISVSHPIVIKWENETSTPNGKHIAEICRVFGVSSDWLLNGWGDMIFDQKITKSYVEEMEKNLNKLKDEMLEIYRNSDKTNRTVGFVG